MYSKTHLSVNTFLFSFVTLATNNNVSVSTIHFCLRDAKSQGTKIKYQGIIEIFVNKSKFKDKNSKNCVNNISNNEL